MDGNENKRYKLPDGRILFVISRKDLLANWFSPAVDRTASTVREVYMTCTRRESGVFDRYRVDSLPLRFNFEEAQKDLDAYAKAHTLEPDVLVKIRTFDPDPAA